MSADVVSSSARGSDCCSSGDSGNGGSVVDERRSVIG